MTDELARLCEDYFQLALEAEPFAATLLGIRDHDAEIPDVSREGEERLRDGLLAVMQRAAAIDPHGLDEAERVSRAMLEALAEDEVAQLDARFPEFTATPFFFGAQAVVLTHVPKARLQTRQHAEDYLTRASRLGVYLDESAQRLRQGVASGLTPVAAGVAGSISQIDGYLCLPVGEDPLLRPLLGSPHARAGLGERLEQTVAEVVRPAMARFRDVLRQEVLPHGRPDDRCGLTWLPDGEQRYAQTVRYHTTTDRKPEELHELGLDQLRALEDEYRELAGSVLGSGDVAEIYRRLRDDPGLRFDDPADAVRTAEEAVARASAACRDWFGRLPSTPCVVTAMPEVEARGMTVAYYQPPDAGDDPRGVYWINTFGPVTSRYDAEAIAFHEALPGHHLQVAIAQELDTLPDFRRHKIITAYVEGWGLYTERLADEMGLYSSALSRLGMLSCDSLRACRLVVDTGLHALGWSQQRAEQFMLDHGPFSPDFVATEVARYVVYPGQALGYMVGRLELLRLRDKARQTLGPRFDVRGFHDTVLGQGAVPFTVLEDMVDGWAGTQ